MAKDLYRELHEGLLEGTGGRLKYTRRAFHMLPELVNPRILDIGCGSGAPTLELARLSQGEIFGIDIDQPSLDRLIDRATEARLSHRIKAINCSMFNIAFSDKSFDIIWTEGSMWIIGLEQGLREWRRLIKPEGFLVVHEMVWLRPDPPQDISKQWTGVFPGIGTLAEYLMRITNCGYCITEHFTLPDDAWWNEYYGPLQQLVIELRVKHADDSAALQVLDKEQQEIDTYKRCQKWYGSAFIVMQKNQGAELAKS